MRSDRAVLLSIPTIVGLVAGSHAIAEASLAPYLWTSRVLIISAPDPGDPKLAEQSKILAEQADGVRQRDLVIIRVIGDHVQSSDARPLRADAVRAATGLDSNRFGVALIGKDGGEKFKRGDPVTADSLFQTIDAMPMRQNEMKRTGPG